MKHLLRLGWSAFILSFLLAMPAFGLTAQDQQAIQQYSKDLEIIKNAAHKNFGVNEISIGGGTARSLILSVMQNQPFSFRDFDMVFSAGQNVTAESAKQFGLELETAGLGDFSQENLRPRPRYNPDLPANEAKAFNAGFGFFVNSAQGVEYDISIYHSARALDLNGIMDVDKFQIRLKVGETLESLVRDTPHFRASILDPAGALPKLFESNRPPAVANWWEVAKSPAMVSIRIVRTLAKFKAKMDEFTREKIRSLMAQETQPDALQISRNLLKLFEDASWAEEFKQLAEIDIFKNQFRSFRNAVTDPEFLNAKNIEDKVTRLLELADKKDALSFLKLLSPLEPELIRNVLPKIVAQKNLKVGYFSGEFSPFHRGHEGVARTALTKGGLDLIFVMAVPQATNDPKTKNFNASEWVERRAFVDAGLKSIPEAWGWPLPGAKAETQVSVAQLVQDVEAFLGNSSRRLTHVFGMDSYHRVVARDLLMGDPRPRIAVTREGVPLPTEHQDSTVKVLTNVETRPISASRLLQEIAVTGTTDYLSPEVLKLVKQTPRYKKILEDNVVLQSLIDANVIGTRSYAKKTIYWDVRENHAGLWVDKDLPFSEVHRNILNQLIDLNPEKIVLTMYGTSADDLAAIKSWEEALKAYPNAPVEIRKQSINDGVRESNKVMVIHSGVLNESIKKKNSGHYLESRGLIIFETVDQPISPLFLGSKKVKLIPAVQPILKNSCERVWAS